MEISADYACYGITSKEECIEEMLVFHVRLSQ